jgi:glucan phosphoethanolaminetransferase (alkaline phosphatase superfamily)
MSPGLIKMWFSLGAIGLMFIAVISILISRTKLKGIWRWILSTIAYVCMIVAGFIMFFVVFSGPVPE